MQIKACEQCGAPFPAGEQSNGAVASCARCGHVQQPRSGTQVFGRATTQMFGTQPRPSPSKPQGGVTQMFGTADKGSPPASPPRASTQMFGKAVSEAGGSEPGAVARSSTQMFGAVAKEVATTSGPPSPPRAVTQMFGKTTGGAAPSEPAPPVRAATQVFGVAPEGGAPSEPPRAHTQVFGSASAGAPKGPSSMRTQVFGSSAEVPSAEPEAPPSPNVRKRLNLRWWAVGLFLGVGLLGFGVTRAVFAHRAELAVKQNQRLAAAIQLLRTDTPQALRSAAEAFGALRSERPDWPLPLAWKAAAVALQLSDAQEEVRALDGAISKALQLRASPEQLRAQKSQREKEALAAAGLEAAFSDLEMALSKEGTGDPSFIRARAVTLAVRGEDPSALLSKSRDLAGWDVLARAEFQLRRADAQGRERAWVELAWVREQDPTLMRAHILYARLAMAMGKTDAAKAALEVALALNPTHAVARHLRDRLSAQN